MLPELRGVNVADIRVESERSYPGRSLVTGPVLARHLVRKRARQCAFEREKSAEVIVVGGKDQLQNKLYI
jgi:hypothetical protein